MASITHRLPATTTTDRLVLRTLAQALQMPLAGQWQLRLELGR